MTTLVAERAPNRAWTIYVLAPLLLTVGANATFVAPVAIDGIAKTYSLSPTFSGGIVTFELVFSAITALGLANLFSRLDVAKLSLFATVVCAVAQFASCLPLGLIGFLACRAVVGLGCGTLYAVACYWASQHANGVRVLSISFMVACIVFGIGMAFWPVEVAAHGLLALYGVLALLSIPLAGMIAFAGNLEPSAVFPEAFEVEAQPRYVLWLLLLMCALANGGLQMLWTFSESTAALRGFSLSAVAMVLSASTVFSVAGALLASLLDRRFGVVLPLCLGVLGGFAAGAFMGASSTLTPYAIGIFLYGLSAFFVLPYLLSAGATLDDTGRAVTLASATVYMAGALGPLLGGIIADNISVPAVGWTSSLACVGAAGCALALKKSLG